MTHRRGILPSGGPSRDRSCAAILDRRRDDLAVELPYTNRLADARSTGLVKAVWPYAALRPRRCRRLVLGCTRGRVCGELIAYAGRAVDGREPKCPFPPGFRKSLGLFNLHLVLATRGDRIIGRFFPTPRIHHAWVGLEAMKRAHPKLRHERRKEDQAADSTTLKGNNGRKIPLAECATAITLSRSAARIVATITSA